MVKRRSRQIDAPNTLREILTAIELSLGAKLIVGEIRAGTIIRGGATLEHLARTIDERGMGALNLEQGEHALSDWSKNTYAEPDGPLYAVMAVVDAAGGIVRGSERDLHMLLEIRDGRRLHIAAQEASGALTVFDRARFNALFRWRTVEAEVRKHELPRGWSKLAPDPMKLLDGYPHLKIRPGFVLRAYQYYAEGNGNAVIWAMPNDAPFPDPEACERLEDRIANAPRPPAALESFMEAVEGDGTPESFLSAAMFARDCEELGAFWHGASWDTHRILFEDPCTGPEALRISNEGDGLWRWEAEPPVIWAPCVERVRGRWLVTFHTYSGHVREAVYRHVDRFRRGSLRSKTDVVTLAEGPRGFIF